MHRSQGRRLVASFTCLVMLWSQALATGAFAQEAGSDGEAAPGPGSGESQPQRVRTIQSDGKDGWSIVEKRQVDGKLIVLSPVLGPEIDLAESNRFSLFQGRTLFNLGVSSRLFDIGVAGFQKAMFMRRNNGKPAVRVEHRAGSRLVQQTIPVSGDEELLLLREYVEHFDEIQDGTYKMEKKPKLSPGEEYPKDTDYSLHFEETRTRRAVRTRTPATVVMKDGERLQGEFVPLLEEGNLLLETADQSVRRLPVGEVDRLRFMGDKGTGAASGAIFGAVSGAATGALAGSLAAWQAGGDVKKTALLGAIIFGGVGFLFGLMSGTRSAKGSSDIVLGPIPDGGPNDREDEEDRRGAVAGEEEP